MAERTNMKRMFCEYCGAPLSDGCICQIVAEQQHDDIVRDYESDTTVNYGWAQQDIIDMYRRER